MDVRDVEAFDAFGLFGEVERVLQGFGDSARAGLKDAEALLEGMGGVVFDEVKKRALFSAARRVNLDFVAGAIGKNLFEDFTVLEILGDMNLFRQIFSFEIKLLEERRNKLLRVELLEVFPIEFAAIDDAASAEMEKIGGNQRRLGVIGENVGVVALRGGDALAFFDIPEGAKKIAVRSSLLEKFFFGGGHHALFQTLDEVVAAPFQEHADVARSLRIAVVRGKTSDARAETAVNVVLQARAGMSAGEVDGAGWNEKALVDEVENAPGEASGKVGAKVEGAVFLDAAGEIDARIFFRGGELDVAGAGGESSRDATPLPGSRS